MTTGRSDEMGEAMEFELADHQSRLDDLEDRLNVVYPTPDTPSGGAQRVRIDVPVPWSVLTVGAQGTAASDGHAIGPGGFGLRTDEHLGLQIKGRTCLDTDGLTIVHAKEPLRFLSQAAVGVAAKAGVQVGTDEGDVEITAGQVAATDPAFTVVPSMAIPDDPGVNTGSPRRTTEGQASSLSGLWTGLSAAAAVRTWSSFISSASLTSGVAAGTLSARVAAVASVVRTAVTTFTAAEAAAHGAAMLFDIREPPSTDDPKVKIHGAGGVSITTPSKVSAFGESVSLAARTAASLKAAWYVSIKSAGYASLYGGAAASVAAEGPAGVKSYAGAATLSGKYADVSAKQTAAVRSDGVTMLSAKESLSMESPRVAIGATEVSMSGAEHIEVEGDVVLTWARRQNHVMSDETVRVTANEKIEVHVEGQGVEAERQKITLDAGGSIPLEITPNSIRASSKFHLTDSTLRIAGMRTIHLG